jgi:glycosyltransferase involved in cell wall biosynthesis
MSEEALLTIGLPVFNGQNYLESALESLKKQSFKNFKVVVSDNCSTDDSVKIAQSYVNDDSRFTLIKHKENIGGAGNFNSVFKECTTPFFKWMAHDDILHINYLEKCMALATMSDESFVMFDSYANKIDHDGNFIGSYLKEIKLSANSASGRFYRILWADYFSEIFAIIRTSSIKQSRMHLNKLGSDRHFVSEILLNGGIKYVPEELFHRRHHDQSYCNAIEDNSAKLAWWDPKAKQSGTPPGITKLMDFHISISRSKITFEQKLKCYLHLLHWLAVRSLETIFKKNTYRYKIRTRLLSLKNK